jgi:hypothetical protein
MQNDPCGANVWDKYHLSASSLGSQSKLDLVAVLDLIEDMTIKIQGRLDVVVGPPWELAAHSKLPKVGPAVRGHPGQERYTAGRTASREGGRVAPTLEDGAAVLLQLHSLRHSTCSLQICAGLTPPS